MGGAAEIVTAVTMLRLLTIELRVPFVVGAVLDVRCSCAVI